MVDLSNWNKIFEKRYDGFFIKPGTLSKIRNKHSVSLNELEDALDDLCWVVRRNNEPAPPLPDGRPLEGDSYDVFCQTSEGRLLKVVGRLYESGRFQIITVLPESKISQSDRRYYLREKELICSE